MTYDELAVRVQLSASAVLRRVRRLEDEQVISRYVALVEPERVGLALTAYINYKGLPTFVKHHPAVVNRAAIDHGN